MIAIQKYYKGTASELLSYYPTFYAGIYEFVEVQKAAALALDKVIDAIQVSTDDSNILTASEKIIAYYEKIIGISYSRLRTVDERRRLVLAYYNIFGKVSATKIKNAIKFYTGADVEIRFTKKDEQGNYILEIECVRGEISSLFLDDIALLCKKIIPAHLFFSFIVTIKPKSDVYVGALPQINSHITIKSKE